MEVLRIKKKQVKWQDELDRMVDVWYYTKIKPKTTLINLKSWVRHYSKIKHIKINKLRYIQKTNKRIIIGKGAKKRKIKSKRKSRRLL